MVITAKSGNGEKMHIYLDGEYVATTNVNFWYSRNFTDGCQIDEDEWQVLLHDIFFDKLYRSALGLLTIREHSRSEVKDKLIKKLMHSDKSNRHKFESQTPDMNTLRTIADEVCDFLEARNLLSDNRFAHDYAEELVRRKHMSVKRLYSALKMKGIPPDIVDSVIKDLNVDDRESIRILLNTKYKNRDLSNQSDFDKTFSALARAGFLYSDIKAEIYDVFFPNPFESGEIYIDDIL